MRIALGIGLILVLLIGCQDYKKEPPDKFENCTDVRQICTIRCGTSTVTGTNLHRGQYLGCNDSQTNWIQNCTPYCNDEVKE